MKQLIALLLFSCLCIVSCSSSKEIVAPSNTSENSTLLTNNNSNRPSIAESDNTQSENSLPTTTDTTDNTTEEDCLATGKEYHAGDIKIDSVEHKSENFTYPQIASPRTPQERKFNLYMRKNRELSMSDDNESGEFSVSFATPEFLSIVFWTETCGASCHNLYTFLNYDLKAGRPIKKLAELFKPGSDFLKTIASYCVRELKRCGEDCASGEWFEKGTKPTVSNYENWNLTRDGVEIMFREYQIGPGVCPEVSVVVPYSHLRGILRQDVEWFRRLHR
jgi:hypothetical protein